ncbi:DUF324 domain-containing protein [hydrothermal vent metagenome]|uniref:DUF324 domain-containing protein n=1 Tax=hydrothermal vent metagenome TaxID=652676 RepID=A0A1W1C7M2_9ZZZZ
MKTRHIAHIIIEADTPLKVGSNASDFLQDSPVQKDWNGLPMILGTSIAGVLRKDFRGDVKDIFGEESGSKVIFSNALLCINKNNDVCEELLLTKTPFLKIFDNLPIREHTAINDKGVAKENSKFDEEIVYKGTRFKFSIEMIEDDKKSFDEILNLLYSSSFRLGGGSTKGFGKIKVIEIKMGSFKKENYENYSSSLNYKDLTLLDNLLGDTQPTNHINYTLKITPDDFFMFGSGFGDSDADSTPVYEKVVDYENARLTNNQILIPASSIKGVLAHRTTYHYNLQQKLFIGDENAKESIKELFGEAKNSKKNIYGSKGKILISDCFKPDNNQTKTFDHVAIDRFTGGGIDGALFQEKTIADDREYEIDILLEKNIDNEYINAFESALKDIVKGMLPLGGMTTKGHGVFSGEVFKDGEKI